MFTRSRQGQRQNNHQQMNQQMNQPPAQFHEDIQFNQPGGNNFMTQQAFNQANNLLDEQIPQPQQQQQQQDQPTTTPNAPRLKPILKTSPGTPLNLLSNSQANVVTNPALLQLEEISNENDGDEAMETIAQPKWRRKVPGYKVNKKLKRLRMNQRLRKTLQPKNAIMVLNEMKTGVQFTFPEAQPSMPSSLFLVHAEIDGKTYVGQGLSKPLARQNAAENALKSLLLEKMSAASLKARIDAVNESIANSAVVVTEHKEENSDQQMTSMEMDEADEVPWSSLASFALYKLFLEWQNQGTVVPVPRPGALPPGKPKKEVKVPVQKELPADAIKVHPVMLLNQMRPGLTYVELCRSGNPPNTMFTIAVVIDGKEYSGTAKNKKDAKKTAAKNALFALYALTYPEDPAKDVEIS